MQQILTSTQERRLELLRFMLKQNAERNWIASEELWIFKIIFRSSELIHRPLA